MRRFSLLLFSCLMLLPLPLNAQSRADTLRQRLLHPEQGGVLIVAHRGAWKSNAENSIASIEAAIEAGLDMVEIDVKQSRDGVLLLMHDKTLGRTVRGLGPVAWHKFSTIRRRALHGPGGTYQVPTLEEALLAAKDRILVNLDMGPERYDAAWEVVRRTGTAGQVLFKTKREADQILASCSVPMDSLLFMPVLRCGKDPLAHLDGIDSLCTPAALELSGAADHPAAVEAISARYPAGIRLWINAITRSDAAWWEHLISDLGARIIQTDDPLELKAYLSQH